MALQIVRRALARWLHRWAESVLPDGEDRAVAPADRPEPEPDPGFFPFGGGPPPAHWVELVKDAAPELLLPADAVPVPPPDEMPGARNTDGHGQAPTHTDVPARALPDITTPRIVETPRGASPAAAWIVGDHQGTADATERTAILTTPRIVATPTPPIVETSRGASPTAAWITNDHRDAPGASESKKGTPEGDAPRGVSTVGGTDIDKRIEPRRGKPPLRNRRISPFRPANHPPGTAGVPPAPTARPVPTEVPAEPVISQGGEHHVAARFTPPTPGRAIEVPRVETIPRPEPSPLTSVPARPTPPPPGVITVQSRPAPQAAANRQPKLPWPALPERPLDDPDDPAAERAALRSWERQRRLDREQQGV